MAEPSRRGFGSVIFMDMAKQWAADVSTDFAEDGLTYSLRIPLVLIGSVPRMRMRLTLVVAPLELAHLTLEDNLCRRRLAREVAQRGWSAETVFVWLFLGRG